MGYATLTARRNCRLASRKTAFPGDVQRHGYTVGGKRGAFSCPYRRCGVSRAAADLPPEPWPVVAAEIAGKWKLIWAVRLFVAVFLSFPAGKMEQVKKYPPAPCERILDLFYHVMILSGRCRGRWHDCLRQRRHIRRGDYPYVCAGNRSDRQRLFRKNRKAGKLCRHGVRLRPPMSQEQKKGGTACGSAFLLQNLLVMALRLSPALRPVAGCCPPPPGFTLAGDQRHGHSGHGVGLRQHGNGGLGKNLVTDEVRHFRGNVHV